MRSAHERIDGSAAGSVTGLGGPSVLVLPVIIYVQQSTPHLVDPRPEAVRWLQ